MISSFAAKDKGWRFRSPPSITNYGRRQQYDELANLLRDFWMTSEEN